MITTCAPPASHVASGGGGCSSGQATPPDLPSVFRAVGGAGQVIPPDLARQVVSSFWQLDEKALVNQDLALTDAIETGAAAEYDDAVTCDLIAGSPSQRVMRPISSMKLYIPPQTAFPARFLAAVQTTDYPGNDIPPNTPLVELLVFVRPDHTLPWEVALRTSFRGTIADATSLTLTSATELVDAVPQIGWVDTSSIPGLLAEYWQHWAQVGGPPSGKSLLLPGYWTTIHGEALETGTAVSTENGVLKHVRYFADVPHDGQYAFSIGGGWAFSCFVTRATDRLTASNGTLHQDPRRVNYGTALEPGDYSAITVGTLHQSCALVPPRADSWGGEAGIGIVGGDGGQTSMVGEPAPTATLLRVVEILGVPILVVLVLGPLIARRRRAGRTPADAIWPSQWPAPLTSPDGRYWWDGAGWIDVEEAAPPHAPRSVDGAMWWDGERWHPSPR